MAYSDTANTLPSARSSNMSIYLSELNSLKTSRHFRHCRWVMCEWSSIIKQNIAHIGLVLVCLVWMTSWLSNKYFTMTLRNNLITALIILKILSGNVFPIHWTLAAIRKEHVLFLLHLKACFTDSYMNFTQVYGWVRLWSYEIHYLFTDRCACKWDLPNRCNPASWW